MAGLKHSKNVIKIYISSISLDIHRTISLWKNPLWVWHLKCQHQHSATLLLPPSRFPASRRLLVQNSAVGICTTNWLEWDNCPQYFHQQEWPGQLLGIAVSCAVTVDAGSHEPCFQAHYYVRFTSSPLWNCSPVMTWVCSFLLNWSPPFSWVSPCLSLSLARSLATSMLLRANSLNCRLRGASGKGTGIASLIGLGHRNSSRDMECNVTQHGNKFDLWQVACCWRTSTHTPATAPRNSQQVNSQLKPGTETWIAHGFPQKRTHIHVRPVFGARFPTHTCTLTVKSFHDLLLSSLS